MHYTLLVFLLLCQVNGYGQSRLVTTSMWKSPPIVGIDNRFWVICSTQKSPVTLSQLSGALETTDGKKQPVEISEPYPGEFLVSPETIGRFVLSVNLSDTTITLSYPVHPITAIGYFGKYREGGYHVVGVGEFKSYQGLNAPIECCGFDARCSVLGFEMIRFSKKGKYEKTINPGARCADRTLDLVNLAESGDIYLFKNGRYKCPGADTPQEMGMIVIEIK